MAWELCFASRGRGGPRDSCLPRATPTQPLSRPVEARTWQPHPPTSDRRSQDLPTLPSYRTPGEGLDDREVSPPWAPGVGRPPRPSPGIPLSPEYTDHSIWSRF